MVFRWPKRRKMLTAAMSLAIATCAFAVIAAMKNHGTLRFLDAPAYNHWLRSLPRDPAQSKNIVVIGIDEKDFKWLRGKGRNERLSDDMLYHTLSRLLELGPRVIGVDLIRDSPIEYGTRSESQPNLYGGTDNLYALLAEEPRVKMVMRIGLESEEIDLRRAEPPEPFQIGAEAGYDRQALQAMQYQRQQCVGVADALPDFDQVLRRAILYIDDEKTRDPETNEPLQCYSLAGLLATEFLTSSHQDREAFNDLLPESSDSGRSITFGKSKLPSCQESDGGYVREAVRGFMYLMDFRGGEIHRDFKTIPLRLLLSENTNAVKREDIEGKVVIIGQTARTIQDKHTTPCKPKHDGVQFVAHQVDQLLRAYDSPIRPTRAVPDTVEHGFALLWALLAGGLAFCVRGPVRFGAGVIVGLLGVYYLGAWLFSAGWWMPVAAPMLTWVASSTLTTSYIAYRERADRTVVRQLFESHVDAQVVGKLMEDSEAILEHGQLKAEEVVATVLFTDLVGFGKASEKFEPPQLIQWLNEYMEPMSELVLEHGGMINKYMGDAIMAVFGAPLSYGPTEDARRAVRCSLAMRKKLKALNANWLTRGIPLMAMRVGITTGKLVAGHLGSERRLEYTVLGDVVNKASRLESVSKEVMPPDVAADGCRIFVSESTHALLNGEFATRAMDTHEMRFKEGERMIGIYGVIGLADEVEPASRDEALDQPPLRLPQPRPVRGAAARAMGDNDIEELSPETGT